MVRGCAFLHAVVSGELLWVGGCLLIVFAVCVLVCSCFGGESMMGTLFAMSVAALIVVGA